MTQHIDGIAAFVRDLKERSAAIPQLEPLLRKLAGFATARSANGAGKGVPWPDETPLVLRELRKLGVPWRTIADTMGLDSQAAMAVVRRARPVPPVNPEARLRQELRQRCEAWMARNWPDDKLRRHTEDFRAKRCPYDERLGMILWALDLLRDPKRPLPPDTTLPDWIDA